MKKHVLLFSITLALLLLLAGCKTYTDSNGPDDYSLQSLTEEDVLKSGSCVKTGAVETNVNDNYSASAKTLHGVETLTTFSQPGSYSLDLSSKVTKGNARLVLCTKEEILHDFALNEAEQNWTFTVAQASVYLRIAGEDCCFAVNYTAARD